MRFMYVYRTQELGIEIYVYVMQEYVACERAAEDNENSLFYYQRYIMLYMGKGTACAMG